VRDADVVCSRTFTITGPSGETHPLIARIGVPRPDRTDWCCDFDFVDENNAPVPLRDRSGALITMSRGYGVDSLQAVVMAIQGVRGALETVDGVVAFADDPHETGIHQIITGIGPVHRRHIEQLVDAENQRVCRLLEDPETRAATLTWLRSDHPDRYPLKLRRETGDGDDGDPERVEGSRPSLRSRRSLDCARDDSPRSG
jgi:hypothetical protein